MDTSSATSSMNFLSGGGEMGNLIRRYDWSQSPLGSADQWPQSLRTSLNMTLHSKFPMFVFWGPEYTWFCNDAWLPTFGMEGMRLEMLGKPAHELWAEVWAQINQYIEQVMTTGEGTFQENKMISVFRNGHLEDLYWTFSYSPVYDNEGRIEGILLVAYEKTLELNFINEVKEREDQLMLTIEAAELATWDLNPINKILTGNDRMKEWLGFSYDEEIDLSDFTKAIDASYQQQVMDEMDHALLPASGGDYHVEYKMVHPKTKQERFVVARGKVLFDSHGNAYNFSGTLQDITEQVNSKLKLQQSEVKFRNMIIQAPVAMCILRGKDFVVEVANDLILEIWEKTTEEIINKPVFEGLFNVKGPELELKLQEVLKTGKKFEAFELPIILQRHGKLQTAYLNFIYDAMIEPDGSISGIVMVANEVTAQVLAKYVIEKSEQELQQLTNSLPNLIWKTDHHGKGIFTSKRWNDFSGIHSDLGGVFEKIVHPDDLTQIMNAWQNSLKKGTTYKSEVRLKSKTGEYFWHQVHGEPIRDDKGIIREWIGAFTDINEQKQAEERLMLATQIAELAVWDLNLQTEHLIYSDRLREVFGYDESETVTRYAMLDHIHPDDLDMVKEVFKQSVSTGFYSYEARLVTKQKDIRWIKARAKVVVNNNIPVRVLGTLMDITEQKLAKQRVEESEERFKAVADTAPVLIWMSGIDKLCYFFNKEWLGFTGRSMEEEYGNGWADGVHPDDLSRCLEIYHASFDQRKEFYMEYRLKRYDGEYRWLSDKGVPRFTADGHFEGYIGACMDIHEQKEVGDELKLSLDKFKLLSDSMPQFVWTVDADGKLNYFNSSVYEYSGLSKEQIAQGGWLQLVHPDEYEENVRQWTNSMETGEIFLLNHRLKRFDGECRWHMSRAIPQRDGFGKIQMWVGTSADIHDQITFSESLEKSVEIRTAELKLAIEELVRTNEQLEQFAYVSSHDLQEPLRKIQTFSEMLQTNLSDDPQSALFLDKINSSALRMSNLIKDLLTYSRLSKAESFSEVNLNEILHKIETDFEILMKEKGATMIKTELPVIKAIPIQMNQLFYNLISNALKFNEHQPIIEISHQFITKDETHAIPQLRANRHYLQLTVKDNGIGFGKEQADKIFVIFQRLNEQQKFAGTGIGLAICKKIVENHHGFIRTDSSPGKGSTFSIYLPFDQ